MKNHVLFLAFLSFCLFLTGCDGLAANTVPRTDAVTTSSGLSYFITEKGTGRMANAGDMVSVHYTGMLTNGFKFDTSHEKGQPYTFQLGKGKVIKGWDEGIAKLRVGDKAVLTIPPALAYPGGVGQIPPNSTLIFVVELVEAKGQ